MRRAVAAAIAMCLLPIAASAQTDAAAPSLAGAQLSQGPMKVEQVHDGGFLVAPDFKFTEIDHRSSGLAGGYAGFVFAEHLFVGGGGYVLASERRGRDLAYGGLVLQWLAGGDDVFGFSAKALLGGGTTESSGLVQVTDRGRLSSEPFRTRQNFLVAEPEIDALIRLTEHLRFAVGAGYRFTGSDWGRRNSGFDIPGSRLNGAVGSVSLQIIGGS